MLFGGKKHLKGKKVAILVANGFEQVEMTKPREALEEEGAETFIVSPEDKKVRGWNLMDWGDKFKVDVRLNDADADAYDALMLPGGIINPDLLRLNKKAIQFIREFFAAGKPVGAICHAPILLAEAKLAAGRRLTSYPSVRNDLINAGAEWVDEEVVVDGMLVSSRRPDDIPAFSKKLIEQITQSMQMESSLGS